MPPQRKNVLTG